MKNVTKRGLAMLIVLVMCLAFFPLLNVNASAADVDYVYSGKYIYNWGTRGEVATFLSPNAEDFYTGSYTYDALSAYSGGTGKSNAPSSALYKQLQSLMKSNHSHITSYAETRDLYKYTDCQNSGGKISSFYSGSAIGPAWGEGNWNREHTWPNSKGLGGSDENDIMMLRPTATSENSSRGNTAYGKSSGYYNPNSESGNKYDLRGDVARIFLYVYVRWGNINYAWGTGGVMESVDVLLEWMEVDPVDTWELGRNDSVESITGTRNVFVDYPEFAFLLFGEEIPENMQTPSGEAAGSKCDHNNFNAGVVIAATCTTNGYTIFTCQTAGCGYSYKTNTTSAKGHNYNNGTCVDCGLQTKPTPTALTQLKDGDVVVIGAPAYSMALSTEKISTYYNKGVSYEDGFDSITDSERFVVTVNSDGSYTFTSKTGDVIAMASDYASLNADGQHKSWTLESKSAGIFYVKNVGRGNYLEWYASKNNWSTYNPDALSDLFEISFYAVEEGGSSSGGNTSGGDTTCNHNYKASVTAPTCTGEGYTTYICTLCSDTYVGNKVAAIGHSYSGGVCIDCGATKPSTPPTTAATLSISFASTANRTEFNDSKQVWATDGLTLTNNKAASSSNVADYSNPARFYASSSITVECARMKSIVFECSSSSYANALKSSITGATASVDGSKVTVTFSSPVDSFTIAKLTAQVRMKSVTVNTEGQAQEQCKHTNTSLVGAVEATCTTDGYTGNTRCSGCGEVLSQGNVIPATGHTFGEWVETLAPTYTSKGAERRDCDNCDHYETREIPVLEGEDPDKGETPGVGEKPDNGETPDVGENPDNSNTEEPAEDAWTAFINAIMDFINNLIEQIMSLFGGKE